MKAEKKKNSISSLKVIARILKDSLGIIHWLLLATVLSIGSAYLAMTAPEVLGNLTNQIYELIDGQAQLDSTLFNSRIISLIVIYLISALFGALTKAIMNYSVTNFFTCKIRVRMSDPPGTPQP